MMLNHCGLAAAIFVLGGCDGGNYPAETRNATANATLPAMKAGNEERVVSGRTVEAVFDGFAPGEPLSAVLAIPAEGELRASVDPRKQGLDHFLAANRGHSLRLRMATVQLHDAGAGGTAEVHRILEAQSVESTADAWWETLGDEERAEAEAATRRLRGEVR